MLLLTLKRGFMKSLKIIILSVLLALLIGYLAFLFVLPYTFDFEKYSPQFKKAFEENTSTKIELSDLKIKTAWDFSLIATSNKIELKDMTGEKFAQIDGARIKISLIPLFMKKIKIDSIEADKVLANLKQTKQQSLNSLTFKTFSENMPDIIIHKYRISFLDGKNIYSAKGSDFEVFDFVLDEKIKIKTKGKLVLNDKEQINYNLIVTSKVFPKADKKNTDFIKVLENVYKYKIKADIIADLNIKQGEDSPDINGKINIDNLSFIFGGKFFPPSSLKMLFNGNKAKINASLHFDKTSRALVTGVFNTGRKKSINLHVTSDKVQIQDVFSIAKTIATPLGLKELHNISANGLLKSDFYIKSDFKKIESSGYLKIKDANIISTLHQISINAINANIDFSKNSIKINQAKALLNSQPITINGTISEKAIADISVMARDLPLKSVLFAFGQLKVLNENNILSGLVNLDIKLNGPLTKTNSKANVLVSNVNLKNIKSKAQVKIAKVIINSVLKGQNFADITGLKISQNNQSSISIPTLKLAFNEQEATIEKNLLYINNIKTNLEGKISHLNTKPKLNPLNISIPNQISIPVKGYMNSKMLVSGDVKLVGDLYNPEFSGVINIPLISVPSLSTTMKNITLAAGKEIVLDCPSIKTANSLMSFSTQINKDFSSGIKAQNAKFSADKIDLNVIAGVLKSIPVGSGPSLTVNSGKTNLGSFKVGTIVSKNITSDFSLKNNVLFLNNLQGDAYFGKIAGDVNYSFSNKKTSLKLQGRGLSSDLAITGLTGKNGDIHGNLDFDSNIYFFGHSKKEILKTIKGNTTFIISNGKMGVLGKFEHLIYAQNVLSNSVLRATLNLAAKALMVKDTGVYRYMKGQIILSDGIANILKIKSSGPSMSLYITGRYYLMDDVANLVILGRISDDVVNILGPIGDFSVNKAISSIPKLGEVTSSLINQYTTNRNYENISEIPPLSIKTHFPTKEFKVVIDGQMSKQSSVKSFKWIAKPQLASPVSTSPELTPAKTLQSPAPTEVPDFVKNLPDFKQ